MAQVECRDCRTLVSPTAEICPKCGAKYPASYLPSKVIINRESSFQSSLAKMIVSIDGQKIGELKNGDSLTLDLSFGEHKLKIKSSVLGGPSKEYVIRVTPTKVHRAKVSFWMFGVNFDYTVSDI